MSEKKKLKKIIFKDFHRLEVEKRNKKKNSENSSGNNFSILYVSLYNLLHPVQRSYWIKWMSSYLFPYITRDVIPFYYSLRYQWLFIVFKKRNWCGLTLECEDECNEIMSSEIKFLISHRRIWDARRIKCRIYYYSAKDSYWIDSVIWMDMEYEVTKLK